jgi:16S rRNA (uracil1498-N3)-methyltransferase
MPDRYFAESPLAGKNTAVLSGPEAHHLAHVMRAKPGDDVILFDGSGQECLARVERVGRSEVELAILSRQTVDRELSVPITLCVALPKGDRQRWLVEKAVELGVARLMPLNTSRGVAQPVEGALARLRRAVIEAAKQCGRNRLMEIADARAWTEFLPSAPRDACKLVAHPGGSPLASAFVAEAARFGRDSAEVWLAIGPEGGFTREEVDAAQAAGWELVDLGPRILRVETAALLLAALATSAIGR